MFIVTFGRCNADRVYHALDEEMAQWHHRMKITRTDEESGR